MRFSLTLTVGEQASDFVARWGRLTQQILSDMFSLGSPNQLTLFVPFLYGFTLGFAVVDDWIERPLLWVPFGLSGGFAVTAVMSVVVALASMPVYFGGMEKTITYATVGLVSLPNVVWGVRRERSRQRDLEKREGRVRALIRRYGV